MVLSSLSPSLLLGQITGNNVPEQRVLPLREQVEAQMRASQYVLGPVRLIPELTFNSTGYVNNVFGTATQAQSDYIATIGLGTQWIVPFGAKVFLRGRALPQYIWYLKNVEGRKFGWTAENSLLLLFNRLSVEAKGNSSRTADILNSETEQRVLKKAINGSANFELEATGHFLVVGGAEGQRFRFTENPPVPPTLIVPDPAQLDRTELGARGGFRYRFSSTFAADLQAEKTRTTFIEPSSVESESETTGYLLGMHSDNNRLFFNFSGGYREGKPYHGSGFPAYTTGTGSYSVNWKATERISLFVNGHRSTEASQYAAYYFETRNGGGLSVPVGRQSSLQAFAEFGANQYPDTGAAFRRRDDVVRYGGVVGYNIVQRVDFNLRVIETRYTSNTPGFTRNFLEVSGGLTLELAPGVNVKVGAQ